MMIYPRCYRLQLRQIIGEYGQQSVLLSKATKRVPSLLLARSIHYYSCVTTGTQPPEAMLRLRNDMRRRWWYPITQQTTSMTRCLGGRQEFSTSRKKHPTKNKTALVLGSSGALGSAVSRNLSQKLKMRVIGADIIQLPTELSSDWNLDGFISLPENARLPELSSQLVKGVHDYLREEKEENESSNKNNNSSSSSNSDDDNNNLEFAPAWKQQQQQRSYGVDVIVVASGGWAGDPAMKPPSGSGDPLLTKEEGESMIQAAELYSQSIVRMRNMNLDPVIAAGFVAQNLSCNENGLMVILGATAALSPTPGMMGYGLAKAATHHLIQTLGVLTANSNSLERKAVRKRAAGTLQPRPYMTVVGILPTTIDTPQNRRAMPRGKFETWAKPNDIALGICKWIEYPALRPHSGSLVKVYAAKPSSSSSDDKDDNNGNDDDGGVKGQKEEEDYEEGAVFEPFY